MAFVNPFPKGVYLDNNATMPLLPSVKQAVRELLFEDTDLANPSSIHRPGQRAKARLYQCKKSFCEYLGIRDPEELVFVSGATEALATLLNSFQGKSVAYSPLDHSAVFDSVDHYPWSHRFEFKVQKDGGLTQDSLVNFKEQVLCSDGPWLLNWQLANNETGQVFDLAVLERLLSELNQNTKQRVFVALDAAQALGKVDESLLRRALHFADAAVFSSHKIGGPTGLGLLWLRESFPYKSLICGGPQERRRRAGTHNILGIAAFDAALRDWISMGANYRSHMRSLRDFAQAKLRQIPGLHFNHQADENSLCNTLNFYVEACQDESLLLALDLEGFYLSSASACNSGTLKPSRVLKALGFEDQRALSSLRFCVGPYNTQSEIELFCDRLAHRVQHIRKSRSEAARILPSMSEAVAGKTP